MSAEMLASLLSMTPLFSGLTLEDRLRLTVNAEIRRYERDESLFNQGGTVSGMYVLLNGQVKVVQVTPDGREVVLHVIKSGQTIAEAAVFQHGVYPAHAVAMVASRVLFLSARTVLDAIVQDPQLTVRMLTSLSNRLREFTQMTGEQQRGTALSRLAGWLLHQEKGEGVVRLEMSRETLASMLGLTRETLSRALSRLQRMGLIAINKKEIRLLDQAGLETASKEA